eukprot:2402184-Pleurochrysis_carterae.AAC.1
MHDIAGSITGPAQTGQKLCAHAACAHARAHDRRHIHCRAYVLESARAPARVCSCACARATFGRNGASRWRSDAQSMLLKNGCA